MPNAWRCARVFRLPRGILRPDGGEGPPRLRSGERRTRPDDGRPRRAVGRPAAADYKEGRGLHEPLSHQHNHAGPCRTTGGTACWPGWPIRGNSRSTPNGSARRSVGGTLPGRAATGRRSRPPAAHGPTRVALLQGTGVVSPDVEIPADARGRRVFLWFGAIDEAAKVWVNSRAIGESPKGVFKPFELDATEAIQPGKPNTVVVCAANETLKRTGNRGHHGPRHVLPAGGRKGRQGGEPEAENDRRFLMRDFRSPLLLKETQDDRDGHRLC